eukprot:c16294_g1_i1.p1 GENE.c16294_g1_i1~~c16294_g1_i1.p1  ORF type:complete len:443 (+),score=235.84 c16294_g1_i1:145-1473(+)
MRSLLFFTLVCIFCQFSDALYGAKSDVIMLTKKNFDQEVMNSNHVWIVEFFAPWCGHCKQLAPIWDQVATKLKGIVKVAAVDADVEKELGGRFGIKGFPTIKVFGSPVASSKPQKTKSATDYNGGRTAKDISNYALSLLPSKQVSKITSKESYDEFIKKADEKTQPKVILFTEKPNSPPLYSSLSLEFHEKVLFGFAKKGSVPEEVLSELGVTSFPTIVLIPSSSAEKKDVVKFDGEMKTDLLIKFVTQNTGVAGETSASKKTEKKADNKKEANKPKAEKKEEVQVPVEVYEINSEKDVETHCVEKKSVCVVAFLDPLSDEASHKNYLATLKEVAQANSNEFNFVWVDIAKQPDFSSHFNCLEIPTLRVWNKKKSVVESVVASMTTKSINQFLAGLKVAGRSKPVAITAPPAIVEGGVKFEVYEETPLENDNDKASGRADEL